ncbi:MAG: hypothetical protein FJZ56_03285 [Chlamydiae bacterium]|nr:hypothetical protein [Chlamydiota bacterium]
MRFEIAEYQINYFSSFGHIEFQHILPMEHILKWKNLEERKLLLQKPFLAKIVASLTRTPKLRMLFEQTFTATKNIPKIFDEPRSLEEISSFQDVIAGVIFPTFLTKQDLPPAPFPQELENVLFIKPDFKLDFKPLFASHHYTLLTFGSHRSIYIYNENDPHTHDLKHRGYVFGDALSQEDSPMFHFSRL